MPKQYRSFNTVGVGCLVFLLILMSAGQAHADVEYYTWGGFETVSQAFQRVALIFSSNGYKSFLAAITMMGLVMGGISAYYKLATGEGRSALTWLIPIVFGAAVYGAFYVPKENVNIYDPVLNRTTTVASVPIGVSKSVWLVNLFERFIVDLLDNNPAHLNEGRYSTVGIQGFESADNLGRALEDSAALTQTYQNFMKDCVLFEVTRPGSSLTWETIMKPPAGNTLLGVMVAAKNPAVMTTEYMSNPSGNLVSCNDSYDIVNNYYGDATNSAGALGNACFSTGFVDTGQCTTNMTAIFSFLGADLGITSDPLLTSANLRASQGVVDYLKTADVTGATAATVGLKEAQTGVSSNMLTSVVNPRMINAYIAYVITLMPLLILFIATPLGRQALGLCMSLILWTMIIRGLDVMIFHMWEGELLAYAKSMGQLGNGVALKVGYSDLMGSQLGQLANLRSSSFLLATAITGAMFKFGDSAMARLADQGTRDYGGGKGFHEGVRQQESKSMSDSNERARTIPGAAMANMARGAVMGEMASAYANAGRIGAGGGSISDALNSEQHASGVQAAKNFGQSAGVSVQQSMETGLSTSRTDERAQASDGTAFAKTKNVTQGTATLSSAAGQVTMQGNEVIGATGTAGSAMKLGATQQAAKTEQLTDAKQRIESAAHDLTATVGAGYRTSNGVQTQESHGKKFTVSDEFARARESATKSALSDTIKRGEQIADTKENAQSQQLYAQAQASGGLKILGNEATIGGGYKVSYQTADKKTHQMTMGADRAKAFEQSFAEKMSSTMKQAKTDEKGFSDSRSATSEKAFNEGLQAADKFAVAESRSQALTQSWSQSDTRMAASGANLETAMVQWYAKDLAGSVSEKSVMNAVAGMKDLERNDPEKLSALQKRFLEENGYIPKSEKPLADPTKGEYKGAQEKIEEGKKDINSVPEHLAKPHDPGPMRAAVENSAPGKVGGGHLTGKEDMEKDRTNIGAYGGNLSHSPMGLVVDTALTSAESLWTGFTTGHPTKGSWGEQPDVKNVQDGHKFSGMSSEERAYRNVSNFMGPGINSTDKTFGLGPGIPSNGETFGPLKETANQISSGLATSAPQVVDGLATSAPQVVDGLATSAPQVGSGLADAGPKIMSGLASSVQPIMNGLNEMPAPGKSSGARPGAGQQAGPKPGASGGSRPTPK